jgi:hypothetical protein
VASFKFFISRPQPFFEKKWMRTADNCLWRHLIKRRQEAVITFLNGIRMFFFNKHIIPYPYAFL